MKFQTVLLTLSATLAAAQSTSNYDNLTLESWNALIPACARDCERTALTSNGCDEDDFVCHCSRTSLVATTITSCLKAAKKCSDADIATFDALRTPMCNHFNCTSGCGLCSTPIASSIVPVSTLAPVSLPISTIPAPVSSILKPISSVPAPISTPLSAPSGPIVTSLAGIPGKLTSLQPVNFAPTGAQPSGGLFSTTTKATPTYYSPTPSANAPASLFTGAASKMGAGMMGGAIAGVVGLVALF